MIASCTCEHAFQDATYGKGQRVFNQKGRDKKDIWTCTVCGRTRQLGSGKYDKVEIKSKKVEKVDNTK